MANERGGNWASKSTRDSGDFDGRRECLAERSHSRTTCSNARERNRKGIRGFPFCATSLHRGVRCLWILQQVSTSTKRLSTEGEGDLPDGVPVLGRAVILLKFNFPVHRIGKNRPPTEKPPKPTWFVLYRSSDRQVRYIELNKMPADTAQLIENNASGLIRTEILEQAADSSHDLQSSSYIDSNVAFLEEFPSRGTIFVARMADI